MTSPSAEATQLFIGLMSGTSVDAVDAVLVELGGTQPNTIAHIESDIPPALRRDILALSTPGDDHVDLLGHTDHWIGELFAATAQQIMAKAGVQPEQVTAIGSHGQTIRHRPPEPGEAHPFTLQIGDPNIIAQRTGVTTVADFRRRDMAAGGHGAPLAPALHNALFRHSQRNRAVVNLGGIANITWLPAGQEAVGYDTGPANMVMDDWCQLHLQQPYDKNGQWAASGKVQLELLKRFMAHPYLQRPTPKSTGREDFNLSWLQRILAELGRELSAQDVQATLLEFTARTVADAIKDCGNVNEVFLCGGGAFNGQLTARLEAMLHPAQLATTAILGIDPKQVECVAFAWMAKRTLEKLSGNLPAVTGAKSDVILGGVYSS
ncbi:anhydro-N-acetylmuramic acid kinase [bacterium SCSIO 12696]|nr:anhydro-N-acetylmuramic acid kinase [bacterium SCSIO 12696]